MTSAEPTRRGLRNRGPVGLYGALSIAILVAIAAIAVTTASSAPPALAEYAPQSIQQIKHAPPNQNGAFGNPGGAPVGAGTPSATPSASASAAAKPTAPPPEVPVDPGHHCVGDPPRQTFDTQSPPCVASWQGQNGGATTKGVTGTSIRIYVPGWADAEHTHDRVVKDLETYFNQRFELYGRKFDLFPTAAGGSTMPSATGTCADIAAQAKWVASELVVFGALDNGSDSCWYDELGRDKVISTSGQTTLTKAEMVKLAPYLWSYPMPGEDVLNHTGQFICSQIGDGNATYSPDPVLQREKRVWGLIVSATQTQVPTPSTVLEQQMAKCGLKIAKKVVLQATSSDDQGQNQQDSTAWTQAASNAVLTMQRAGVTTLICACQLQAAAVISSNANSQGYRPEIVAERSDQNLLAAAWVPAERTAMVEVSSFPRQLVPAQTPFIQAIQEVDPGFCPCGESLSFLYADFAYEEMLLLASGVQMAGPHLTPQTFADALHRTVFPNPPSPLQEGRAGFANGSYSMVMDTVMAWFDNNAPSPLQADPPGSWCYVDAGRRYLDGQWPKTKHLPSSFAGQPCVT